MIVVSNATPLIGLVDIGRLKLLNTLFDEIYIPKAVYHEVTVKAREEGNLHDQVVRAEWINTVDVMNRVAVTSMTNGLDIGEVETIILAQEMDADLVIMDERQGRYKLAEMEMSRIGTLGVLLKAKQMGLINEVKPELDKLRQMRFRMSDLLYSSILNEANES